MNNEINRKNLKILLLHTNYDIEWGSSIFVKHS